jgi:hypothetical protein
MPMAEHGFLFTDPLARAILRGEKIDTRRPITKSTSQSVSFWSSVLPGDGIGGFGQLDWTAHLIAAQGEVAPSGSSPCSSRCDGRDYCCTFIDGLADEGGEYLHVPGVGGQTRQRVHCRVKPGDTLWVREAWRVIPTSTDPGEALVGYRAGGFHVRCKLPTEVDAAELSKWNRRAKSGLPRWTPSLLMPRWAARSVRRVLAVHAERLGPLTVEQARDEGFGSPAEFTNAWDAVYRSKGQTVAARPWVWVIRFGMPEAAGR